MRGRQGKVARNVVDDGEDDDEVTESTKTVFTTGAQVKEENLVDGTVDVELAGEEEFDN